MEPGGHSASWVRNAWGLSLSHESVCCAAGVTVPRASSTEAPLSPHALLGCRDCRRRREWVRRGPGEGARSWLLGRRGSGWARSGREGPAVRDWTAPWSRGWSRGGRAAPGQGHSHSGSLGTGSLPAQ